MDIFPGVISAIVKGEANKAFPVGGEVRLRGDGASIDIGINAFVVDIPLEVEVPNWFNADIDVSMGFSMFSEEGRVRVKHDFATTRVSFGVASSILSSGVSAVVATALEKQSDAFGALSLLWARPDRSRHDAALLPGPILAAIF